jgi:hypothetical protein
MVHYDAEISKEDFNAEGYVENQKDKSTYFVWKEAA